MREILFRGKSIITNEWVYGGIVHQTDFYGDIVDRYYIIDGTDTRDYDIGYSERVIPETVGQYTGLTDKNGKKIFEGDIILYDGTSKQEVIWDEYEWNLSGFYNLFMDNPTSAFSEGTSKMEIIGNIYDNPELLEVSE